MTGRGTIVLQEVSRSLVLDMRAAEFLYESQGEHWTYWLAERCAGELYSMGGQRVRVTSEMAAEDLTVLLLALLASDRARTGRVDTADEAAAIVAEDARELQRILVCVVQPSFEVPGKGLRRPDRRHRKTGKKRQAWDWKRALEVGTGLLRLSPEDFWGLSLVDWQTMVSGYAERERLQMRKLAWLSSNQFIAAGAKPETVTVAKLLGEKEPRRRRRREPEQASPEDVSALLFAGRRPATEQAAAKGGK